MDEELDEDDEEDDDDEDDDVRVLLGVVVGACQVLVGLGDGFCLVVCGFCCCCWLSSSLSLLLLLLFCSLLLLLLPPPPPPIFQLIWKMPADSGANCWKKLGEKSRAP